MKRISVFLILIIPLFCIAQKQGNIWYFGAHAGLNFNSGSPVPLTNGQTYSPDGTPVEGTAVISDSSGSLLFYTNGMKIWNKNQQVMPNGDSLLGGFSSTQAALIVPQPGSSRYFYVFTTDAFYPDTLKYGFRYSKIDMCLDSGLGDVMPEYKNIKLLDTVCEKLTGVRHANGIDYWIIVHKYYSDAFYSYSLSSAGITDTVISHIGSRHPDTTADGNSTFPAIGQMKASLDGNKLAIVNGNSIKSIVEYFDFNKSTGIISNCINLVTKIDILDQKGYYGVSFSPDNSKLYISGLLNDDGIFQFNLNAGSGNADSVVASKIHITNCYGMALQLAIDGKIYVAINGSHYLAVINNPNNNGVNCNFADSAIYLNGKICNMGLPNFIDSYDYSNTTYNCSNGIEEITDKNQAILYNAYPDPFTETTTIKFFIPGTVSSAYITFYDEYGNELQKSAIAQTGAGQIVIFSSHLSTGIYSYSLTIDGNLIDTKRMVKIK